MTAQFQTVESYCQVDVFPIHFYLGRLPLETRNSTLLLAGVVLEDHLQDDLRGHGGLRR